LDHRSLRFTKDDFVCDKEIANVNMDVVILSNAGAFISCWRIERTAEKYISTKDRKDTKDTKDIKESTERTGDHPWK